MFISSCLDNGLLTGFTCPGGMWLKQHWSINVNQAISF